MVAEVIEFGKEGTINNNYRKITDFTVINPENTGTK